MTKILLTGDSLIMRQITRANYYRGFDEIIRLMDGCEVRFTNLESVITTSGYPALFPGGGYARCSVNQFNSLRAFGFNLFNCANNHVMDYGIEGLMSTINALDEAGLSFAGIGSNLFEASKASYLEANDNRIALVGCTSSFHDSYAAGNQNSMEVGRPGVNPLRHKAVYSIPESEFEFLTEIAARSGINDYHKAAELNGYLVGSREFAFGNLLFSKGSHYALRTEPNEKDRERILLHLREAVRTSTCCIFSIHTHQFSDGNNELSAQFVELLAHDAIDVGVKVVVCHGPHLLRGIEVYKGSVIFYSLGNFIFQNESVSSLPSDFLEKYDLPSDTLPSDAFLRRNKNETVGFQYYRSSFEGVIPILDFEDNKICSCTLYPIELQYDGGVALKGWPILSKDDAILEKLASLSKRYGTQISIQQRDNLHLGDVDLMQ